METDTIVLPPPTNPSDASLVFGVCLFLMAIVAIFMAIRIPRLLALFGTSSDWIDGFLLCHVPSRPSRRVVRQMHHARPKPSEKENNDLHGSMGDVVYHQSYPSKRSLVSKEKIHRYPPHIPSCSKALRPLLKLFRARISPGFSIGQLLVLVIYLVILLYAAFYKSSIFLGQSRTGWIAVSQYPFVYAFAQKNNLLGTFLGFGYEKV